MAQLDYMEKRGSGLKRILNETKALKDYKEELKPVFKSTASQFMTIIYSVDYKDTGNVVGNVAGNVKRIVLVVGGGTLTRDEIMQRLGLRGSGNFRAAYLYSAIEQGYIAKLYPESDKRPDQAYYLTEKGLKLLAELKPVKM